VAILLIQTGAVLAEHFYGVPGPWKVLSVERQKIHLFNNSRTTCISEPKQSLHEENNSRPTIMILSSQLRQKAKKG